MPDMRNFCLMSCMSMFASPPDVCGKHTERNKMLSNTISTYLVLVRRCLRRFIFLFFTAIAAFLLLLRLQKALSNFSSNTVVTPIWGLLKHDYINLTRCHDDLLIFLEITCSKS